MRLLDLFCGRWGWSRAFAARGWECVGVDLAIPKETPEGCVFYKADVLTLVAQHGAIWLDKGNYMLMDSPDLILASPPCQEFSKHGLRCFYPNPPYPESGIKLFNHTRQLCEASGVPFLIENVRAAQKFVGDSDSRCGPFHLWGNAAPLILPSSIRKGRRLKSSGYKSQFKVSSDDVAAANAATIPPELANCIADYAERILEQRKSA